MRDDPRIHIVDYGVGNIASLVNMFDCVGVEANLCSNPTILAQSSALILPGVGSFDHAMVNLRQRGFTEAIKEAVANGAMLLGVCLGMQLLARNSEEGDLPGLGLIAGEVKKIIPTDGGVKVPNMGWREVVPTRDTWITSPKKAPERFYFAHSYHVICDDPADVAATIDYDGKKAVAIERGNVCGVQFHPEKSHRFGMRLLKDFARQVR